MVIALTRYQFWVYIPCKFLLGITGGIFYAYIPKFIYEMIPSEIFGQMIAPFTVQAYSLYEVFNLWIINTDSMVEGEHNTPWIFLYTIPVAMMIFSLVFFYF